MALKTYGTMGVDWEERVDFERLRVQRLARIKQLLKESDLGALLCFDMTNIRYITATHIGTWAMDKLARFTLLPQDDEPILWDFGSAARHHKLYCPWLGEERSRAGISTQRGAMLPAAGRAEEVARKIRVELEERGLLGEPLGVDEIELPVLFALQAEGIKVVDGQQLMQQARLIKTQDEITLLNTACMMVDAAYDDLYRFMKPGVRENECVGLVSKSLYDMGSEHVEGVNAISGERCSPHPHVFSDRALRPGDPAYFDILHSFNGYRTCYYRTFAIGSASPAMVDAYKKCRDILDAAINAIRPGVTTADVVKLWPKAPDFGFPDEEAAFALQYGHGVGLSIWEKPIFSRLVSLDHPEVIQEGMVFALETFWPASDGWTA
ncbi:MAG: M24 family metallopeptidase, partial [Ktedonobacterales bacterium]